MAKILVIEDEPDQNKLIKLRLEARGYLVISAGKAKEGIELAKKERPDLILMDMILPDMHGLDATIKLKRSPETGTTPIIALSAVGSPDFMKACLQEGILAYVRKPYDPRELFKIIEKYVPAAAKEAKARVRPAVAAQLSYQGKLEEIEKEFKKRPEKPAKRKESVDELLEGALADFKMSPEKRKTTPAQPEKRPARPKDRPKSILLIDDDLTFAKMITPCLTKHGYEVMISSDAVTGLKQAFQQKPDIILLNLVLPGGGGEGVLANLRKAPDTEHLPVFIMSGLLSPRKLEEKAREIGAQGFISKPVEPEDLLYIIDSVIGS